MLEKLFNLGRKIIPKPLFRLGQPIYHFLLAFSGNIIYRFPGRNIICIGVTGTNGKSTTVELINSVLKADGKKTGMLSTVAFEVAGERRDNVTARTTLGRWQTPRMLREMVKKGVTHAVIEVASEGIMQFRTWGIPFDVAVFTNLSPEHLNTHKTMTRYRNTKGKLFAGLVGSKKKIFKKDSKKIRVDKVSVINADDREGKYFASFPADKYFRFGLKRGEIRATEIKSEKNLSFIITDEKKNLKINSPLLGTFNAYNILAAYCACRGLGIERQVIKRGVESVALVPGRMQEIPNKKGIRVFVDYAMTPDSYELLYGEMRKLTKGKLITVFGAAGGKDRTKRPKIGKVAATMADLVILTDDEPYNEDPKKIIEEIESGIKPTAFKNYKIIQDRKTALKKSIELAKPGDVIVVPGMGHEKNRNVGGNKRIPWDEPKLLADLLK